MQERSATKYRIITWHFERCFCKNEVEVLKNTVEAELVPIEIWRVWKCKHRKKVSPKDKKSPILCWVFLWGNVLFWKIVFASLPHRRRACGRTSCCWATPPSGSGWTWRRRSRLSPPRRDARTWVACLWAPGVRGWSRSPAAWGPDTGGDTAPCRCPSEQRII